MKKINVGLVIVCAGRGERLGKVDKALLNLEGKPLFYRAFEVFKGVKAIKRIVLVLRKEHFKLARKLVKDKRIVFAEGGKRRRDSVRNGLLALGSDIEYALIHDGARPFTGRDVIERVLKQLKKHPAVICAVKVKDTLKTADKESLVKKTLNRKNIFSVQTPQGFRKNLILKAYEAKKRTDFFDDAQAVELMGKKVKIVKGSACNIKITYLEDIALAKAMRKM